MDHYLRHMLFEDDLDHLTVGPFVDHDAAAKEANLAAHVWRARAATGNGNANLGRTAAANGVGHGDDHLGRRAVPAT